jgi:hypothetical protein
MPTTVCHCLRDARHASNDFARHYSRPRRRRLTKGSAWRAEFFIRVLRGPLNPFQGDYLCSFVSIRGWQKNPNFPRYIEQDFPQYPVKGKTNQQQKQRNNHENTQNKSKSFPIAYPYCYRSRA